MKQIEVTPRLAIEEILRDAQKEDVVLTRKGHAVAILSEMDDEELAWYAQERNPEFLASIARARAQVKKGQVTDHKELKQQLGIKKAK